MKDFLPGMITPLVENVLKKSKVTNSQVNNRIVASQVELTCIQAFSIVIVGDLLCGEEQTLLS